MYAKNSFQCAKTEVSNQSRWSWVKSASQTKARSFTSLFFYQFKKVNTSKRNLEVDNQKIQSINKNCYSVKFGDRNKVFRSVYSVKKSLCFFSFFEVLLVDFLQSFLLNLFFFIGIYFSILGRKYWCLEAYFDCSI